MRNVIFAINITLDRCCDHTNTIADEEILEHYTHLLQEVDLLVYGRKTYQLMVPYWPDIAKSQSDTKAANEFARAFDSSNKIVFSRSLDSAEDKNTRIVRANLPKQTATACSQTGRRSVEGLFQHPQAITRFDPATGVLSVIAMFQQLRCPVTPCVQN